MPTLERMNDLPDRIQYLRACPDAPPAYADIARAARISPSAVAQAATGVRKAPTMRTLQSIARAFRAPLDWVATGTGPRPSRSLVRAAVATWGAA